MMVAQSQMVREVLTGGDSGWKPQRRNDGSISLGAAMRLHRWHMLLGFVTAGVTWYLHHDLFFWMLPVTGGLMVSAVLSWLSGKIGPGRFLRFFGVLRTPEEKRPPQILQSVHSSMESMTERPQTAPVQVLLSDPDFRDWHCAQLQPDSSINTAFDPELILARAKAERSISAAALEDWLTLGEEMALLHSPDLIRDVVASLPVQSPAR